MFHYHPRDTKLLIFSPDGKKITVIDSEGINTFDCKDPVSIHKLSKEDLERLVWT
jgi:hypothetical protein